MPSSDSEDFESADEGQSNVDKKERKQRLSSSNYSDNALEPEAGATKAPMIATVKETTGTKQQQSTDGWEDFDLDEKDTESTMTKESTKKESKPNPENSENTQAKENEKSQDTGWDDFDDWGDVNTGYDVKKDDPNKTRSQQPQQDIREAADRMSSFSNTAWGWGWGVDSLLSSATAGISSLTTQVSQGISTVLETGIGAPDPEDLARKAKEHESKPNRPEVKAESGTEAKEDERSGGDAFPFGNLLSGVTKFVETTGTKVIAGGLDTLETIGKKTMEVLQDGDPGLAKKRAMLGLDPGDKPVLSQVLREAKIKAEEEDRIKEEKREAKEVHYENLFDDFEGLVHLEALEMLSRQVSMRIEERIRSVDSDKKLEIKETLLQVSELCEMPEEEEDEEEPSEDMSRADAFHERLQTATQDLGLKLQFQAIVKQYTDILDWLSSNDSDITCRSVYKRAVSGLAQATALSVEIYHKAAEMLLVKTRRSTADEADALTQMTVVLTKHISELATLFTEKMNSITTDNKDQLSNYITNIFLEAGNSSTYIQNAFQLALPILQIGAV